MLIEVVQMYGNAQKQCNFTVFIINWLLYWYEQLIQKLHAISSWTVSWESVKIENVTFKFVLSYKQKGKRGEILVVS